MKLKFKNKISYCMGDFSYSLVYIFLNAFILAFLTEVVHISAAKAGILVLLANICDAVSDPVIGYFADRRKSKGGKYKNWIKIFIVPAAIFFVLFFFVPDLAGSATVIYCYVIYLIWTLIKTCVQVPYSAMSAALTNDSMERVSVGAIRDWMSNIGGIIISVAAVWVVGYFGSDHSTGYRYAALIISAVSILGYYLAAITTKEEYFVAENDLTTPEGDLKKYSIFQALGALLSSKYAIALIAFVFMGQLAMGIRTSLMTYYCTYYLEDTSLSVMSANMTLCYVIPIVGIMFIPKLIGKIGRRPVMCIGGLFMVVTGLISLVAKQNFMMADLSGAMVGCGICFQMSVVWGAMPDTADYVFYHKGIPVAGLLTAFITLGMAAGTGVCGFLASIILNTVGYDAASKVQTAGVGNGLYLAFGIMPMVFGFLMVLCAWAFNLRNEKH